MNISSQILRLARDLNPSLGLFTEGPCLVMDRVRENVDPRSVNDIVIDLEDDGELTKKHEHLIYDPLTSPGPNNTELDFSEHAQFRMDLRSISIPLIKSSLQNFMKDYLNAKSRQDPKAKRIEEDLMRSEPISWEDKKLGITVVFRRVGKTQFRIITTYWNGVKLPKFSPHKCAAKKDKYQTHKKLSVSVETLPNGITRVTTRQEGRTLLYKDGLDFKALVLDTVPKSFPEHCGIKSINMEYIYAPDSVIQVLLKAGWTVINA